MKTRAQVAPLQPRVSWLLSLALASLVGFATLFLWPHLDAPAYAGQLAQALTVTEMPPSPLASRLIFVVNSPTPGQARLASLQPPARTGGLPALETPLPLSQSGPEGQPAADVVPPGCEPMGLHAAPRGSWMAVELACGGEASLVRVSHAQTGEVKWIGAEFGSQVVFLGWSPNGQYAILLRDALSDAGAALVNAADGSVIALNAPGDVYNVALSNDGTRMVYSLTRGLGFGSETWLANVDGSAARLLLSEPRHIIAYARFSPDDSRLAYIRMPDSNVPFTVGELWVVKADGTGQTLLDTADAGHGYAPTWSPDGTHLAYVYRENDASVLADQIADRLASNIHLANLYTGAVQAVTSFAETLVEAPAWSPDGMQLAFTARPPGGVSDVWVYQPAAVDAPLTQATQNAGTRYPVFTSDR